MSCLITWEQTNIYYCKTENEANGNGELCICQFFGSQAELRKEYLFTQTNFRGLNKKMGTL